MGHKKRINTSAKNPDYRGAGRRPRGSCFAGGRRAADLRGGSQAGAQQGVPPLPLWPWSLVRCQEGTLLPGPGTEWRPAPHTQHLG